MAKVRLDTLLVARGLAENRTKAQALLLAGSVRVNGRPAGKPGTLVDATVELELTAALPYASRGGYKLAHALDSFALDPHGLTALDVGASTGGFTDVLLQRGAACVYAVDVGYGILDYRLRADPRVVVLERTNIRHLEALPPLRTPNEPPRTDCAVIDVSFISLRLVLPAVQRLIRPDAWIVALIKPQFEAGPDQVGKGGVVRDVKVHRAVLRDVTATAAALGLALCGLTRSPITGPAGNVEFLAWLQSGGPAVDPEVAISAAVS
jgi:23S rRNA (cytidine1920-2'-O)/16S rRNA (cytidine1409-2'-O)-methyltransferase